MTQLHLAAAPIEGGRQSRFPRALKSLLAVHQILLAMDFTSPSSAALQVALHLAKKCHAKLTLLHVLEYADVTLATTGSAIESFKEDAQHQLDQSLEKVKASGLSGHGMMKEGLLPGTILEAVSSQKPDLLVIGTSGLHGTDRFVFGSTAEAILQKVLCPVMTVGPACTQAKTPKQAHGPVLFATDFNLATTDAVRQAALYSQILGTQLCCLHILPRSAKGTEGDHVVPEIMTGALQHIAAQAPIPGQKPICDVGYGSDISYAIVDYAKQHSAQLIVLGVRRASMVASHLPAHIAYRVIAEAPCPVVTIAFDVHGAAF
jgi:nucleotide-binding universal stress UspA family protein